MICVFEVSSFRGGVPPTVSAGWLHNLTIELDVVPLLLNGFGGGEEQPVVVIHDALTNGVRKRLPRSSSGRVALVSDAAYAPSFLTGQGSSLALVGAYMLTAALADRNHTEGFAAYERTTRAFVTVNQELVGKVDATLFPTTARALEQPSRRNSSVARRVRQKSL